MWIVLLSHWNNRRKCTQENLILWKPLCYNSCLLKIWHISPRSQDIYDLQWTITPLGLVFFHMHQTWEARFNAWLPGPVYSAVRWDTGKSKWNIITVIAWAIDLIAKTAEVDDTDLCQATGSVSVTISVPIYWSAKN